MGSNVDSRTVNANAKERPALPGRVVLVMQGGGAPGSYQAGAYQALHEAGIEPDWIIGTSIGAINGAIIAGNEVPERLPRLHAFWERIERALFHRISRLLFAARLAGSRPKVEPKQWRRGP